MVYSRISTIFRRFR